MSTRRRLPPLPGRHANAPCPFPSPPDLATLRDHLAGVAQLVERQLPKRTPRHRNRQFPLEFERFSRLARDCHHQCHHSAAEVPLTPMTRLTPAQLGGGPARHDAVKRSVWIAAAVSAASTLM